MAPDSLNDLADAFKHPSDDFSPKGSKEDK